MRSRVPAPAGRLPELVVEDSPAAADVALLEERVAAAAMAAAGVGEEQEFGIFARDADGRVVAGISAVVWGGYCELQAMWVDEALRNRGLAHALMSGAEDEARRRGCRSLYSTHTTCSLVVCTSASDTRQPESSRTVQQGARRAGTARCCESGRLVPDGGAVAAEA